MKDNIKQAMQVILIVLGPLLIKHHITFGNDFIDELAGTISDAWGIIWKFWHWNSTPDAPAVPPPPTATPPMSLGGALHLAFIGALIIGFIGCAAIKPGEDALVVNVERAQTVAAPTFDLLLGADNSNRSFWQTKAPAFHTFAEWLRERQIAPLPTGGTTNVQRAIALQLNLDNVKLAYKSSQVSSNALVTAAATLQSALDQANAWLVIVTNPAPVVLTPQN